MNIRAILRATISVIVMAATTLPGSALAIDYAKLFAQVSPSVVTIKTQTFHLEKQGFRVSPGIGSGFMIESDLIMTAAHVVQGVDVIEVGFSDDTSAKAELVSLVDASDVALLKLNEPRADATIATLGVSDDARVGSPVFVVGAPFGLEQTLSVGHLSGRMERGEAPDGTAVEFLQTDTAINPGNSGGPMFNEQAEVIGVVSFILSKSGGFNGIGFASSVNSARKALMASAGTVAGFDGLQLTSLQSRALNIPDDGVLIQRIVKGSIADELGLKAGSISAIIADRKMLLGGDVILSVDCTSCANEGKDLSVIDIAGAMADHTSLDLSVFRDGQIVTLSSQTAEEPIAVAPLASAESEDFSALLAR